MPIADVTSAFNWPAPKLSTAEHATKALSFIVAVDTQIFSLLVAHHAIFVYVIKISKLN
jgi:hypothetical protein